MIKKYFINNNCVEESVKTFLSEFVIVDDDGKKVHKYGQQLTTIANRNQVSVTIDLDDMTEYNDTLTENIMQNTRRYSKIFSDAIMELLPSYKTHEVTAKDSLDIYIEHRLLMEQRTRPTIEQRDERNRFPSELMKRL